LAARARTSAALAPARGAAVRREITPERGSGGTDIRRDPEAPTVGVHWGLVAIALVAATWFVLTMVVFYGSGDAVSDYLLWIVGVFAAGFFVLTLGLARWAADDPRWARRGPAGFADFIGSNVAIFTGAIYGREAMTQLLTLPVALTLGATIIGIVFWVVA
jgi:hypothetical protein